MPKFLFKSTQNHWYSRLAKLGNLLALVLILFKSYLDSNTLSLNSRFFLLYFYLEYGLFCFILILTAISWFLKNQLTLKPFFITLSLLALIGVEFFIIKHHPETHAIFMRFLIMVIHLVLLGMLWWLTIITTPKKFALSDFANDHYRIWAFISLLLISAVILLTTWFQANNGGSICINDHFCILQLFARDNLKSLVTFWITYQNRDANALLIMSYYSLSLVTYLYLGGVGFWIIFNKKLNKIGLLIFALFVFKLIFDQMDIADLNPKTIAFIDFSLQLLLLLATISFLSELYQKLQLKW